MEIFNTLGQMLTTPNAEMANIICAPLIIVEAIVTMLLFTTILNITATTKRKIIYVCISTSLCMISRLLIPMPYGSLLNILILIFAPKFILNISFIKSVLAQIIPFIITLVLESIIFKILLLIFNLSYETVAFVPIYKFTAMFSIYFTEFLLYLLLKHLRLNINLLDKIDKKNRLLILSGFFFANVLIAIQIYLISFYSDNLPIIITILSIFTLIAYFMISLTSLARTNELKIANQNLEQSQLYNKTLTILHDNIRCFKHDFHNIIQAIGGYIHTDDIEGLKKYYKQISADCQKSNNLAVLNPDVINNPAVYSILAAKYHQADAKGITINLEIFLDLNTLRINIYEFTRILGILLDNAIEASSECNEKLINITVRDEVNRKRQLIVIENTYTNKNIDTEKIYEKGFSTKDKNTGLGLWEVRKILSKNNNLNLFTSKNDKFFSQQLEIY